jgi:hypothetical protein
MSVVPFHQVEYTPVIVVDEISKLIFPQLRTLMFVLTFSGSDKKAILATLQLCQALPTWNNVALPNVCRLLKSRRGGNPTLSRFVRQLEQQKDNYFDTMGEYAWFSYFSDMKPLRSTHIRRLVVHKHVIDSQFNNLFSKMHNILEVELVVCDVSAQFRFPERLIKLSVMALDITGNRSDFCRALPSSIKSLSIGDSEVDGRLCFESFLENLPQRLIELKIQEHMHGECLNGTYPSSLTKFSLVTVNHSTEFMEQLVAKLPRTILHVTIDDWISQSKYEADEYLQPIGAAFFSQERFPLLRSLALKNCGLVWNDASVAWDMPKRIESLNLSGNLLTDACMDKVLSFFPKTLARLEASENKLTSAVARARGAQCLY